MIAFPGSFRWSRFCTVVSIAREPVLAAFFVALAGSISASEILLTLLILLLLPWGRAARIWGTSHALATLAREVWTSAEPLCRHPLTLPFLCWTGLTILSAAFSGDPGWSFWIARDTLRITTFYVVLSATRDVRHAGRLWQGFLLMLTLMAGYGLAQAALCRGYLPQPWLAGVCTHPSRVRGPYSIYMTFGAVLMLGALVCIAHLAHRRWRSVGWMVPAGALMVTTLAFTYARNAWLGLAAGTLGLVVTARRAVPVIPIVVAVTLVGAAVAPDSVRDRVRSIANAQDPTIRDRLAMWRSGLAMIRDHPVLGVGPGEVRAWYPSYRRPEAVRLSTGHLHNSAIHIAAERGVPALAVWIWLWVIFFREGGRVWARLAPDQLDERALVAASLGGVAGFLVAALFEHSFGNGVVVMLVYALMALPFTVARALASAGRR